MGDEILKDLDQNIVKIKGMASVFKAFSDMSGVLDFIANDRG
jgi:hypothetical protein